MKGYEMNEQKPSMTFQQEYTPCTKGDNMIDPLQDDISSIELIRVSGSDLDVVNAARVSYGKVSKAVEERDKILIEFLMEHGHTSPFEHNQLSFRVKAPIFVVRQWMRHRLNSYNEISYRYVKAPLEFYIPTTWRKQDKVNKQSSKDHFKDASSSELYKQSLETSAKIYVELLEREICREQARGVLPLATYTEFIFTCNLQSLFHFIKLRTEKGAQQEIRSYAWSLLFFAKKYFPISTAAFEKKYGISCTR